MKDREGFRGGEMLYYLGHPTAPHQQQSASRFSTARPHSQADVKVIGTDKPGETVMRGIRGVVFV